MGQHEGKSFDMILMQQLDFDSILILIQYVPFLEVFDIIACMEMDVNSRKFEVLQLARQY